MSGITERSCAPWRHAVLALLLAALPAWSAAQDAVLATGSAEVSVTGRHAGEAAVRSSEATSAAGAEAAVADEAADEIAVPDDDAPTVRAAGPIPSAVVPAAEAASEAEANVFALNVAGPSAHCSPCASVPDPTLDQVRGGFSDSQGLVATFGIERATYINGNLVASGSVNIQDLRNITVAQAEQLRSVLSGFNLIQNGPGNTAPAAGTVASGTLIQNTLSDQTIVNRTVLNATTNSLQFVRAANAQTTLRDALTAPLGPR